MAENKFKEAQTLEDVFFHKHDAALIAELRRREAAEARKKMLAEVSGISDDSILTRLVEHNIHPETLAAFSLVPIVEVAWADGAVQAAEAEVILRAMERSGIAKDSLGYQITEKWLQYRPDPRLNSVWKEYTRALISSLDELTCAGLRSTVLAHARSVAEAAGGFLGFGRISDAEEKVLRELSEAFEKR